MIKYHAQYLITAFAKLTLMYSTDFVDYIVSLNQIGGMFKQLDRKYGKPNIQNPKKMNGQIMLRNVIKFLAENKQATCEDIAKKEIEGNINRNPKSIIDNIRKFIKNNLIFPRLVMEDGFKKVYNKQITTYSLTPVGILYAIYLFSNLRIDEDGVTIVHSGQTQEEFDEMIKSLKKNDKEYKMLVDSFQPPFNFEIIRNLAKEYSDVMPKVFGKLDYFENFIGDEFETVFVNAFTKIFDEPETSIPDQTIMLSDFARYDYWSKELTTHSPDPLIAEQFSLLFYANLEEGIDDILFHRDSQEWFESQKVNKEIKKRDNKQKTQRYKENLKIAKKMWLEILNHDKKIKNWYFNFVKMALKSKRFEHDNLWWYKKELSQNSMNA